MEKIKIIKILLLILFFPITLLGQNKVPRDKLTEKNNLIFYNNKLYTGISFTLHENEKKKQVNKYVNGICTDRKEYDKNGQLEEEGIYHHITSRECGLWKTYHENGQVDKLIHYDSNGITGRVGEYKRYYENGNLSTVGYYELGMKQGIWKNFHKDGTLDSKQEYKDDILIKNIIGGE